MCFQSVKSLCAYACNFSIHCLRAARWRLAGYSLVPAIATLLVFALDENGIGASWIGDNWWLVEIVEGGNGNRVGVWLWLSNILSSWACCWEGAVAPPEPLLLLADDDLAEDDENVLLGEDDLDEDSTWSANVIRFCCCPEMALFVCVERDDILGGGLDKMILLGFLLLLVLESSSNDVLVVLNRPNVGDVWSSKRLGADTAEGLWRRMLLYTRHK